MAATDGEARTVGNSLGGRTVRSDAAGRGSLARHIVRPLSGNRAAGLRQPRSVEDRLGNGLSRLVRLLARQAAREWVQQAQLGHPPRHQFETNPVGAGARGRSRPAS
jgi:hypothetical protein